MAPIRRTVRQHEDRVFKGEVIVRRDDEGYGDRPAPGGKASRSGPEGAQSVESRQDLFRLFAETADGVWISAPSGETLFWNRSAEAIMGYSAQEVVGRMCCDIFDGRDTNGNRICIWPCSIKMRCGEELLQHFEMATQTKTGKPLRIDISCIAVPSDDGQLPTIIHLFRDVTAAHQLQVLVRQQLIQGQLPTHEEATPPVRELSKRELQVVNLLRAGVTTAAIAKQLFISQDTVRSHMQRIFSKLKVHSRLEVVTYLNQIARRGSTIRAGGATGQVPETTKEAAKAAESHERND
ncbi:MAG: PAS domain-containing protein [candidate division NC10 bacterium]|nr:PAS domain-containing protein [candidate division NC10 bacterium]